MKEYSQLLNEMFPGVWELAFKKTKHFELEISGLINFERELLTFDNSVTVNNRKVDKTLKSIEKQMQTTIMSMINRAVNSFPNFSLDEWIFDYPTQIVVTAIHMIITHEIIEMIKILNIKHQLKQMQQNSSYENSSIELDSIEQKENKIEEQKFLSAEEQKELKLILQKPSEANAALVYSPTTQKEINEMFGKNFANTYLGTTKAETISILSQKSFRGLYLRLQFWINQLMTVLYRPAVNPQDPLNQEFAMELQQQTSWRTKSNIQNVLMFVTYMRDIVLEIYENSSADEVKEFDWNKHVRLMYDADTNGAIISCGGWSGYQGNEYLSSNQHYLITPLTEKYFVFISSALREKSGVAFKTNPNEQFCSNIVYEFANLCTTPVKQFYVGSNFSVDYMLQIVRAGTYANCWIVLEHINNLSLEMFAIVCKEMQLLQQKYILSEINSYKNIMRTIVLNNEANQNKDSHQSNSQSPLHNNSDSNGEQTNQIKQIKKSPLKQEDLQESESQNRISYGLFVTYQQQFAQVHMLPQQIQDNTTMLNWLKSGFRVTSLQVPEYTIIIEYLLFISGFTDSQQLAKQINKFFFLLENLISKRVFVPLEEIYQFIVNAYKSLYLFICNQLEKNNNVHQEKNINYLFMTFSQNLSLSTPEIEKSIVVNQLFEYSFAKIIKNKELLTSFSQTIQNQVTAKQEEEITETQLIKKLLEKQIGELLKEIFGIKNSQQIINQQDFLQDLYKKNNLISNVEQQIAIQKLYNYLVNNQAAMIVGQPHTGKSVVIKILIEYYQQIFNQKKETLNVISFNPEFAFQQDQTTLSQVSQNFSRLIKYLPNDKSTLLIIQCNEESTWQNIFIDYLLKFKQLLHQHENTNQFSSIIEDLSGEKIFLQKNILFIFECSNIKHCTPQLLQGINVCTLSSDIFDIKSIIQIKLEQIYYKLFSKNIDKLYISELAISHEQLIVAFFEKFATQCLITQKAFTIQSMNLFGAYFINQFPQIQNIIIKDSKECKAFQAGLLFLSFAMTSNYTITSLKQQKIINESFLKQKLFENQQKYQKNSIFQTIFQNVDVQSIIQYQFDKINCQLIKINENCSDLSLQTNKQIYTPEKSHIFLCSFLQSLIPNNEIQSITLVNSYFIINIGLSWDQSFQENPIFQRIFKKVQSLMKLNIFI